MSTRHDTYGWRSAAIDDVARQVDLALLVHLEPRSSLYRGEYYTWRGAGNAHLILQENAIDDVDGLPTDDAFPEHAVLLYASSVPDAWFDRLAALPGAERLHTEVTP